MKLTKSFAILALNKDAKFNITNDDLSTIVWLPEHTGATPTVEEIEAKYAELQAAAPNKLIEKQRQKSYQAFADPLFFKWQAGEATEEEWVAKRQEIKASLPYQE
jgi:hypothetical protein